jgi:hypothetical protein
MNSKKRRGRAWIRSNPSWKENPFFGPSDINAMSIALDEVCKALRLDGNAKAKEVVAIRIIELARRGERSPTRLRDRLLTEANGGTGC